AAADHWKIGGGLSHAGTRGGAPVCPFHSLWTDVPEALRAAWVGVVPAHARIRRLARPRDRGRRRDEADGGACRDGRAGPPPITARTNPGAAADDHGAVDADVAVDAHGAVHTHVTIDADIAVDGGTPRHDARREFNGGVLRLGLQSQGRRL